jgi:hypothetical protein
MLPKYNETDQCTDTALFIYTESTVANRARQPTNNVSYSS